MIAQVIFEGLINGSILALIAMGIALIWGVLNILSFSQGEFLMLGMFVAFYLNKFFGIDPIYAIPICMTVLFLVGVLLYKTIIAKALKGPILSQRLITFALSMVLVNFALMVFSGEFKTIKALKVSGSLDLGFLIINYQKLVPLIASILVATVMFVFMNKTRMGKAIRATSLNKAAAELMGINTEFTYAIAFGISSAIAGAAGCVLTYYFYIYPGVGTSFQLFGFVAVALGGFGSITGAFVGGLLMGLVDSFTGFYLNTAFKYFAVCVVFMLVVSFRPKGLFGR